MSSTTTAGAISFWAGNTDRNNAAFRVDNNGKLVCTDADVAGNINAKLDVLEIGTLVRKLSIGKNAV